jgi:hypothetical protein
VYLSKLKGLEMMLGRDGVRRCVQETYSSKQSSHSHVLICQS